MKKYFIDNFMENSNIIVPSLLGFLSVCLLIYTFCLDFIFSGNFISFCLTSILLFAMYFITFWLNEEEGKIRKPKIFDDLNYQIFLLVLLFRIFLYIIITIEFYNNYSAYIGLQPNFAEIYEVLITWTLSMFAMIVFIDLIKDKNISGFREYMFNTHYKERVRVMIITILLILISFILNLFILKKNDISGNFIQACNIFILLIFIEFVYQFIRIIYSILNYNTNTKVQLNLPYLYSNYLDRSPISIIINEDNFNQSIFQLKKYILNTTKSSKVKNKIKYCSFDALITDSNLTKKLWLFSIKQISIFFGLYYFLFHELLNTPFNINYNCYILLIFLICIGIFYLIIKRNENNKILRVLMNRNNNFDKFLILKIQDNKQVKKIEDIMPILKCTSSNEKKYVIAIVNIINFFQQLTEWKEKGFKQGISINENEIKDFFENTLNYHEENSYSCSIPTQFRIPLLYVLKYFCSNGNKKGKQIVLESVNEILNKVSEEVNELDEVLESIIKASLTFMKEDEEEIDNYIKKIKYRAN